MKFNKLCFLCFWRTSRIIIVTERLRMYVDTNLQLFPNFGNNGKKSCPTKNERNNRYIYTLKFSLRSGVSGAWNEALLAEISSILPGIYYLVLLRIISCFRFIN